MSNIIHNFSNFLFGNNNIKGFNKNKDLQIFFPKTKTSYNIHAKASYRQRYKEINTIAKLIFNQAVNKRLDPDSSRLITTSAKYMATYLGNLYKSENLITRIYMRFLGYKSLEHKFEEIAKKIIGNLTTKNNINNSFLKRNPIKHINSDVKSTRRYHNIIEEVNKFMNFEDPINSNEEIPVKKPADPDTQVTTVQKRQSYKLNTDSSSTRTGMNFNYNASTVS